MMWQDKQNAVCLERSKCSFRPQKPQRIGNAQNARNARILPPGVAVKDERIKIAISNAMVVPRRTKRMAVGPGIMVSFASYFTAGTGGGPHFTLWVTARSFPPLLFRSERAHVAHEIFNFRILQLVGVLWHLVLAV